jgi:hypothetical protein
MRWNQPNVPLLITGVVIVFFSLAGCRSVFALPYVLPANWVFPLIAVSSPASYFAAVRKTFLSLSAGPVLLALVVFYFSIWSAPLALQHVILWA